MTVTLISNSGKNPKKLTVKPAGTKAATKSGFKAPEYGTMFRSIKSGKVFKFLKVGSNGKARLQPEGHSDYYEVSTARMLDLYEQVKASAKKASKA